MEKSGGDAHIWFLRKGGVTGEADYKAKVGDKVEKYEFQYSDIIDSPFLILNYQK